MPRMLVAAVVCVLTMLVSAAGAADWEKRYCLAQYNGQQKTGCLADLANREARLKPYQAFGAGMGPRGYVGRCGGGAC